MNTFADLFTYADYHAQHLSGIKTASSVSWHSDVIQNGIKTNSQASFNELSHVIQVLNKI